MGRRIAATILLMAQAACLGSPSRVREPTSVFLQSNPPERIWATLADGQQVVIERPQVIRDTVFGFSDGRVLTVPADQVTELKVRKVSVFRSALIPGVLGLGLIGTILLVKRDPQPAPVDSSDFYQCRNLPDPTTCT